MRTLLVTVLTAAVLACENVPPPVAGEPGAPLPGLSPADSGRFLAGRALFNKTYTPAEGLGPTFNENQCSACHTVPAAGGGTGFERVVKASRYGGPGVCDPMAAEGGENVRTQATPLLRAHGTSHEEVPAGATEIGRFLPTFLFGMGLVEAIPEETILEGADPEDADGDGISGRAARDRDGVLTRFGRKADFATIEDFTRSALRLEMGLTTRGDEVDIVAGVRAIREVDPVAEPEVDDGTVELLTAFQRFLVPLAAVEPITPEQADTLAAGERLFHDTGCSGCHTPTMRTGPSDVPALDRQTVRLYSDLLLHDMGPGLANVCAGDASPTELRTAILAGLQHRERYLHDGRTNDLWEAILSHGGEAQSVRDAFSRLPWLHQHFLITFLRSL